MACIERLYADIIVFPVTAGMGKPVFPVKDMGELELVGELQDFIVRIVNVVDGEVPVHCVLQLVLTDMAGYL